MATGRGDDWGELLGFEAIWWLHKQKLGDEFLSAALLGVGETFGHRAEVSAAVPDAFKGPRTDFFLGIIGRPDRREDWDRLVEAHRLLYLEERAVAERLDDPRRQNPFARFHLVLDSSPVVTMPLAEVGGWALE